MKHLTDKNKSIRKIKSIARGRERNIMKEREKNKKGPKKRHKKNSMNTEHAMCEKRLKY